MRRRVLVLRALGLGDVLTAVPALRAVRRGLPDHELVLAAPAPMDALVKGAGLVDRVHPAYGLGPLGWKGPPPDVAVNLHGCGPESHLLLRDLDPGRLVAFARAELGVAGPAWVSGEHEVHRWCRLVSSAGWAVDPRDLRLDSPRATNPAPGAVVVHPGAAAPSRRWPVGRFARVANWLQDRDHRVVVTGSPDEVELADQVAAQAGLPSRAVLAGRTDLAALSALVAGARLVVSGDTGVAHLAYAHGTPSVVVFGPTSPDEWGPPASGPHTVVWKGKSRQAAGGGGDPHGTDLDSALAATGVSEVISAIRDRLEGSRIHDERRAAAAPLWT
ncbi:glycosyltransferase family 9 protein [Humibacillus xanthopallidus]|uniref:ADP-heptose:LPS heptosyltransferase n=1 Tax=Humibacillus xanthopallidus TaxID=412689 RepID=A0A543HHV1_9MICO|nr:glycosyltransferase family 9 protein [Humibacillus xanthopallidus]TQM57900.1 ADP-heptose:LPS heptosyltransferase [Humibacillus xanthopallidus]